MFFNKSNLQTSKTCQMYEMKNKSIFSYQFD